MFYRSSVLMVIELFFHFFISSSKNHSSKLIVERLKVVVCKINSVILPSHAILAWVNIIFT